ncbi:MAG: hydantoinase/oxoprolinase family protein [Leucobacter sp.]|nr:hydantoinase/oxoprolinase family protein [Leucobacter sp.]
MTRSYRIAIDTGGTFTDLVLDDGSGQLRPFKARTTPDDPTVGILGALMRAAQGLGIELTQLLERTEMLIHGTTRALNAVTTGDGLAKTAFLTTAGHPDILLYGEGGRTDLFDYSQPGRKAFIPRQLTFEVPERIGAGGEVVVPLDESEVRRIAERLRDERVEAVGICLLWSPIDDTHERRVEEILREELKDRVAITLSSRLNPTLREYRRAASTVIDAALKPLMTDYLDALQGALAERGFAGRLLVITSAGGFQDAHVIARSPILSIKSGPAMAPNAGRFFAEAEGLADRCLIVTDTGGTTYDVSVIVGGRVPTSRETWLGKKYISDLTGFNSVDIRSVGAGGGSIAWVDSGGVLRVGPHSAGAQPGPVAYGAGGTEPTLSDACLVLGYLDPETFLGGAMELDVPAAAEAIRTKIAEPLGVSVDIAAEAIHRLATERMVEGVEEITLSQGLDTREAVLVAGGGAGGLNAVSIAARLGVTDVLLPNAASVMSAFGALGSELSDEFEVPWPGSSATLDLDRTNEVLRELRRQAQVFLDGPGVDRLGESLEYIIEARYPNQIWDLELPIRVSRGADGSPELDEAGLQALVEDFHALHLRTFAVQDTDSPVEIITWKLRANAKIHDQRAVGMLHSVDARVPASRSTYFRTTGRVDAPVRLLAALHPGERIDGPALIELDMNTVVIDAGAVAWRTEDGSLRIKLEGAAA